jgi:hypothetical protein
MQTLGVKTPRELARSECRATSTGAGVSIRSVTLGFWTSITNVLGTYSHLVGLWEMHPLPYLTRLPLDNCVEDDGFTALVSALSKLIVTA